MYIKTEKYQIKPDEIFKLMAIKRLTHISTFLLTAFIVFMIIATPNYKTEISILLFYIIYILGSSWQFAHSKKNKAFYKIGHLEVDDVFIGAYGEDDGVRKVKIEDIVKVERERDHVRVYITLQQFFYVPYKVFKNKEDMDKFNSILEKVKDR